MFNYFVFNISHPQRLAFQTVDGAYPKDPKAAALISGDIDQVFAAFGLEPGFLNRKQFLIKHPEIIEYINAKIGETRIQPTADGYRGTSAENGAYIEFFKEHAGNIENMVHESAIQEQPIPSVNSSEEASEMPTSQPVLQETPVSSAQEPSTNPILPVQEIQSINTGQEQILTHEQETAPPPLTSEPPQEPTIQPAPQELTHEPISEETNNIIEPEHPSEFLGHEPTPTLDEQPISENQPSYIFSSPPSEPPSPSETLSAKSSLSEPSTTASADELMAPYQADIGNEEKIPTTAQSPNEENEIEKSHEEAKMLESLYDLEELSWWPNGEELKLQIKDARNGIMEVIQGAGLNKRSILYAITLLENGNIWLFTDDPTVPQEDRDLVVDFDEFKSLIESSF